MVGWNKKGNLTLVNVWNSFMQCLNFPSFLTHFMLSLRWSLGMEEEKETSSFYFVSISRTWFLDLKVKVLSFNVILILFVDFKELKITIDETLSFELCESSVLTEVTLSPLFLNSLPLLSKLPPRPSCHC